MHRHLTAACLLFATVLLPGCGLLRGGAQIDEPVNLIAVLPIERAEVSSPTSSEEQPRMEPDAEKVVTAQIYAVLSASPKWRFVPDLTVSQSLGKLPPGGDLATRAIALGKAVGADAVLCGTLSRFVERVGTEYGARQPAAVAFTLQLVSVSSGKTLWTDSFDQQQQPLSENLLNWWQFWRGGPKWFTATEFARIGIERLLDDLAAKLGID